MPPPGNGVPGVYEKAGLWDVVGENQFFPCVHLGPLQLLVSNETGKTSILTQGKPRDEYPSSPQRSNSTGAPKKLGRFATVKNFSSHHLGPPESFPGTFMLFLTLKPYQQGTHTYQCR